MLPNRTLHGYTNEVWSQFLATHNQYGVQCLKWDLLHLICKTIRSHMYTHTDLTMSGEKITCFDRMSQAAF